MRHPDLFTPRSVDLFAGGGGASLGILWGTGAEPLVAVNHDPAAIAMLLVDLEAP
jgi:DNA (cytosine-5)-methyltransferase 1